MHLSGIIDSTLREGEQAPGVHFNREQKLSIIEGLIGVGVDEMELGVASPRSPGLIQLSAAAAALSDGRCRLSLWCRCRPEDINFAARCGADILSLSIPVSDLHIRDRLRRDRHWVRATLHRSVLSAFDAGFETVSVGLEDATRADFGFLAHIVETLSAVGASRIRIADTVGIATPGTISDLIGRMVQYTDIPIGIHTHNDFGMATANGIAALEAGARWVDVTVLGLGERTGNCRLEEVIGYLSLMKGYDRYHPQKLRELCKCVARAAHIAIPRQHPLVGRDIFTCETGLHVHGLTGNPETYEPYDPARVGRHRLFCFGGKSGRRAVWNRLSALGIYLTEAEAEDLVVRLRQLSDSGAKLFNDRDLVELAGNRDGKVK